MSWYENLYFDLFSINEVPEDFEKSLEYVKNHILNETEVEVLNLYYRDGLKDFEIAEKLGKTLSYTRNLRYRVKNKLRCLKTILNKKLDRRSEYLNSKLSIDKLGLSVRAYNCLKSIKIKTLQDLINFNRVYPLCEICNLGKKTFEEISDCVKPYGFDLKYDSKVDSYDIFKFNIVREYLRNGGTDIEEVRRIVGDAE